LVVDLEATSLERFRATAGFPENRVTTPTPAAPASTDSFVVVLDPGHGGVDKGSQGPDGALEKAINLAVAEAVRDGLEATGRYRVVMTRDRDRSVALDERVRIAREAGADLFLSIHADADERSRSTRGASVYTLADYAEGRSRSEILQEDPWILDVDLSIRRAEVGDILIDLVHRDTKNQSTAFAEALIPHLRSAGPLLRNTHRSAGFYVLLAPDVPAVLLEAGFITNPDDEARLTSRTDRRTLADAIVAGIDDYFDQRERLYAAR
jgi:N-acetylmuramoyl-L-alanine amidase